MEITEIIERFNRPGNTFDYEAVAAAIAHREEITSALLRVLADVAEQGRAFDPSGTRIAQLYAIYLLAQFRETRAYPLVVRIALLPGDVLDVLFGDFVTTALDSALASVCGGDLDGIKSIIEDESADEWARGAAIDSLLALVVAGVKSREEVLEYFASLYRGKLARTPENAQVWSALVCSTADLYPEELMSEIERAYQDDLVDEGCVELQDVRRDLARGKQRMLQELAASPHHQFINDTAKELGSWYSFHKGDEGEEGEVENDFDPWDDDPSESDPWLAEPSSLGALTYRRTSPKIGRNDPCPCGSGKKYKKCCIEASQGNSDIFDAIRG